MGPKTLAERAASHDGGGEVNRRRPSACCTAENSLKHAHLTLLLLGIAPFTASCPETTMETQAAKSRPLASPREWIAPKHGWIVDVGEVEPGESVDENLTFQNSLTTPIEITDVSTSCSCNKYDYTRGAIAPGQSGIIEISFSASSRTNMFRVPFHVVGRVPDGQPHYLGTFEVIGEIRLATVCYTQPESIVLGRIKEGTAAQFKVDLVIESLTERSGACEIKARTLGGRDAAVALVRQTYTHLEGRSQVLSSLVITLPPDLPRGSLASHDLVLTARFVDQYALALVTRLALDGEIVRGDGVPEQYVFLGALDVPDHLLFLVPFPPAVFETFERIDNADWISARALRHSEEPFIELSVEPTGRTGLFEEEIVFRSATRVLGRLTVTGEVR